MKNYYFGYFQGHIVTTVSPEGSIPLSSKIAAVRLKDEDGNYINSNEAEDALVLQANTQPELVEILTDILVHLKGGAQLHDGSMIFKEDAIAIDAITNALARAKGVA